MKRILNFLIILFSTVSCQRAVDKEKTREDIFRTEKEFEKMVSEKGIAGGFYHFADSNAVVLRENDTLIKGKDAIRAFYSQPKFSNATVSWTPDYIDVSDCGTLAYTYGKYLWKTTDEKGDTLEHRGVFHTVWKKQKDKSWKYVWD